MLEYISQFTAPIAKTVSHIFLSLAVLTGANLAPAGPVIINNPVQEVDLSSVNERIATLGANISAVADFRSTLNAGISSSDTTMTLVSFTSGSDSLTVGETYGFKIAGQEYVIGTASTNNQIINLTRGVSRGTGTSTVAAYQKAWGRGAAVEITDAPILVRTANILGGKQNLENVLKYDSTVGTSTIALDNRNLVNTELLNYTAFNGAGVINASQTQKGVVEIATQAEARASSATGSTGAPLVLAATIATSTWNSATASSSIPLAGFTGKIDTNFISTTTLFTNVTLTATTTVTATSTLTIGSFSAYNIGKNVAVITTTGTSTFNVPTGITRLFVQVQGGGGDGGGAAASNFHGGSGGGGGGYSEEFVDVTGTSTIQVFVGTSSGTTKFGTNGFYLSATGGTAGSDNGAGGAGGSGSGGDINIVGQGGGSGIPVASGSGGNGGSSFFGGGGQSCVSGTGCNGVAGGSYGGGGGGGYGTGSGGGGGGGGANGVIKISW